MRFANCSAGLSRLAALASAALIAFGAPPLPAQSTTPTGLEPVQQQTNPGASSIDSGSRWNNLLGGSSSSDRRSRRDRSSRRTGTSSLGVEESSSSRRNRSDRSNRNRTNEDTRNRANRRTEAAAAGTTTGAPGAPARAVAGQERSVVRRQAQGGGGTGGGGGDTVPLPEISVMAGTKEHALYFTPPQLTAQVGDRFATGLDYYNPHSINVESLNVWVKYDPLFLEPDWIDTAPLTTTPDSAPQATVWREQGYIRLEAPALAAPLSAMLNNLATIHWRALKPVATTRVEAVAPEGEVTELLANGENVLAIAADQDRGRVSADIHIIDPAAQVEGLKLDSYAARRQAGLDVEQTQSADPMRLAIVPAGGLVATGEVSTADIMLLNPGAQAFDAIRLRIRYDPTAIKILDADEDNYILNGINIYDGGFHDRFPFDFHAVNDVDPERGVIEYWMGVNSAPRVYPDGTFARIVFRMLRPAGEALFWFERIEPGTRAIATDVSAGGRSLLGETNEAAEQVLHGAKVGVRPLDMK